MMAKQVSSKLVALTFGILVISLAIVFYAVAWTEPSQVPPGGNVASPLNTGQIGQTKGGWLATTKSFFIGSNPTAGEQATAGILRTTGGAIINTAGALYGLIIDQGKVGIGTPTPSEKLDIDGNAKAASFINIGSSVLPGCTSANRGQQYLLQSGAGIEDGFYICKKKPDGVYNWYALGSPQVITNWSHIGSIWGTTPDWQMIRSIEVPSDAKKIICSLDLDNPYYTGFVGYSPRCGGRITYQGQTQILINGDCMIRGYYDSSVWEAAGGGTLKLEAYAYGQYSGSPTLTGASINISSHCYHVK